MRGSGLPRRTGLVRMRPRLLGPCDPPPVTIATTRPSQGRHHGDRRSSSLVAMGAMMLKACRWYLGGWTER